MKFLKINLLIITALSAYLHVQASDKKPSSAWQRARAHLDAAQGRTAPDVPQAEQKELPTLKDIVAPVESEKSFIATMRGYLSRFTGCKTWDESCAGSCPSWDKEMPRDGIDLSTVPGFNQPITCKSLLGSCYQQLEGCSQERLDGQLQEEIKSKLPYPQQRCRIAALVCQGANPNVTDKYNSTALDKAVTNSDYYLVKFLHARGADLNAKITAFGGNSLHRNMQIYRFENERVTRFLLKHGVNINAKDEPGDTPLQDLAIWCNDYTFSQPNISSLVLRKAQLLINAGAATHLSNEIEETAYKLARANDHHPSCKALADFLENYEKRPNRIEE